MVHEELGFCRYLSPEHLEDGHPDEIVLEFGVRLSHPGDRWSRSAVSLGFSEAVVNNPRFRLVDDGIDSASLVTTMRGIDSFVRCGQIDEDCSESVSDWMTVQGLHVITGSLVFLLLAPSSVN